MTTPARSSMVPPNSGAPTRPGVDCPQCGSKLSKGVCSCGHRERR